MDAPGRSKLFTDSEVAELARGIALALNLVVEQVVARVTERIEEARLVPAEDVATPSAAAPKAPPTAVSPWMTIKEAAAYTRRGEETLYRALRTGFSTRWKSGLKGYQTAANSPWRIHRDDLELWIRGEPPSRGTRRPHR
ncbi:MAG TPA: helix-turn-helix domain-containing protein [Actinophytocola sp.]|uniref:helix-turn-helix domain-containing protein n=1 Tax=Actinophytocola sp. TaxID=1872138 RepID=UPI002DDD5CFA|nr:helix-turn-helix domain-containing protein [Actinophytocola sp.]HEV2777878.1 helix-turn-helix domain-containing protein [Actinophytocola sp.]